MRVTWTREALKDLDEALAYIADDDSDAARDMAVAIKAAAKSLARLPNRGRPGFVGGTRELIVPNLPYFFVFWVQNEQVEILRLMHF
ncbi:MAG: type II toxin-antitoxin system RelE/ParE family toxin, partial [Deltaproteobacteria bacterium]|nr:type II toxin-antitoxin system RelE/ParE family toxin [Deltaproteobacteria bacterium]